jgi:chemotaxis protein methyltransferase CheR
LESSNRFLHLIDVGEPRHNAAVSATTPARLVSRPAASDAATPESTADFLLRVLRIAGLKPERYRGTALQRRAEACLRALRVRSFEEAERRLARCPELLDNLLSTLLVGVTEFFRDPPVFDYLRTVGLAHLTARHDLRAVSLGCSDGRELYSLAMLLAEQGLLTRCTLEGVDCRMSALEAAHAGWFDPAALEGVPVAWRARYFHAAHGGYRVADWMRSRTRWWLADACTAALPECDVLLCRNVLIYLSREAGLQLWHRLAAAVRPGGGLLITGRAERAPLELGLFRVAPCVYLRKE